MQKISINVFIEANMNKVWTIWNTPKDIEHWYTPSPDWHTPKATNDLIVGGKFDYRMEAKDGSFGFNFWGIYDEIVEHKLIKSTLGDDRKLEVIFEALEGGVSITEIFDTEDQNPIEMQEAGWQSILNNFKNFVESN